jgi:hypothetical protein
MTRHDHQRGMSVPELLVATAIGVVVLGAAIPLLGRIQAAALSGLPQARRAVARAEVHAELNRASDTAAGIAYFDLQATTRPAKQQLAASVRAGGRPSGDAGEKQIGEGVAAPGGSSGGAGGEPGGRRSKIPTISLDLALRPIVSYGTGVRVGERLRIAGPLEISPGERPIFSDQTGDAVTFLRAEPSCAPFTLGVTFDSGSGAIRLVARDKADVRQILELVAGDVLLVNGRTRDGSYVTALAELTGAPHQVNLPSVTDASDQVLFTYYEASISPPGATYAWGLRNAEASEAGIDILEDASVALLDRAGAVLTYYTAVARSSTALYRVVGDPDTPVEREQLVARAAAPMTVSIEWSEGDAEEPADEESGESASPGGAPEAMRAVVVRVPVEARSRQETTAEPIDARIDLVNGAHAERVLFHYRYLGVLPTGTSGAEGPGGDGK